MGKENLEKAKKIKNDEFYTRIQDIENELQYYVEYFKGKHIFLNCDDPEMSNFWKYFKLNFGVFGLKKLTATHYHPTKSTYKIELSVEKNGQIKFDQTFFKENGDFRSKESIEILKECDIVITNPPFSLFREYVAQLMFYKKKFLIIGNKNAFSYKEIFPLIKDNEIWVGQSSTGSMTFLLPNGANKSTPSIWLTNLDNKRRNEELILYEKYTPKKYPKYDNYDAINIDKTKEIPVDYDGEMGVPITFLLKHNPKQFEIIGLGQGNLYRELNKEGLKEKFVSDYFEQGNKGQIKTNHPVLGYYRENKAIIPYMRIIIKKRN